MAFPTRLPRQEIEALLASGEVTALHRRLLRWLIWIPLLSITELCCLLEVPARAVLPPADRPEGEQSTYAYSTMAAHLQRMRELGLVQSFYLEEYGWARERRFYLTDLGLYIFAAHPNQPLSVERLVRSYPIDHRDLLARLQRPRIHLALTSVISRLFVQGRMEGITLLGYRQPWTETFAGGQASPRVHADAGILLRIAAGAHYVIYLYIDDEERGVRDQIDTNILRRFLLLSQHMLAQEGSSPSLLILCTASRRTRWMHQLAQICATLQSSPPPGGVGDLAWIQATATSTANLLSTPWCLTFADMYAATQARQDVDRIPRRSFADLLHYPASPALSERLARTFSLQSAFLKTSFLASSTTHFPCYIGTIPDSPTQRATASTQATGPLRLRFQGTKEERIELTGHLNLLLTGQHKAALALLARHPFLNVLDLHAQVNPHHQDMRPLQRALDTLQSYQLVDLSHWPAPPTGSKRESVQERRRYQVSETGLRFLAERHALPRERYLQSEVHDLVRAGAEPPRLWKQRGSDGLEQSRDHTRGLYRCVRAIAAIAATRRQYRLLEWRNSREAQRHYRHPVSGHSMFVWPDAELLYQVAHETTVRQVLIEYDRGTEYERDYAAKFEAYLYYQWITGQTLPPLLIIVPHARASRKIQTSLQELHALRFLTIILVDEPLILIHGLLPFLQALTPPVPPAPD